MLIMSPFRSILSVRICAGCLLVAGFSLAQTTFTLTGSMNEARSGHTATLLNNGTVLVAGGTRPDGQESATAEIYNPQTGTWRYTGVGQQTSMTSPRTGHSATKLADGRVLLAGGIYRIQPNSAVGGTTALPTTSAEIFDPVSETFTQTGLMNNVHVSAPTVLLRDGRVMVVGGLDTQTYSPQAPSEIYDPNSGTWLANVPALPTGSTFPAVALLPSGDVFVADGENFCCTFLSSAALYAPATNSVRVLAGLLAPRASGTGTVLPSGKILIVGGVDSSFSLASTEIYDPEVLPNGQSQVGSSLNTTRRDQTATLLPNGDVVIIGGRQGVPGFANTVLSSAELRSYATGSWSEAGIMSTARIGHTAALLASGQVLVTGGLTADGSTTNTAELWGPVGPTGTISVTTNLSADSFTIAGPATYHGGGQLFAQANAPAGTYTISYTPVSGYQTPQPATLQLSGGGSITFPPGIYLPILTISNTSPTFSYTAGSSGPMASMPIKLAAVVPGLAFTTEIGTPTGGNWLSISNPSGPIPSIVNITVSAALGVGTYKGTITFTVTGTANSPIVVNVTLIVNPPLQVTTAVTIIDPVNPTTPAAPNLIAANHLIPFNNSTYEGYASPSLTVVQGIAADGVTPLLLRFISNVPGIATFVMLDSSNSTANQIFNSSENGQLTAVTNETLIPQQTVTTKEGQMAVALYTAPAAFWRSGSDSNVTERLIYISVFFKPIGLTGIQTPATAIKIVRPPVMLVHGIWSSASAWDAWDGFGLPSSTGCKDSGKYVACRIDYKPYNAQKFAMIAPKVGSKIRTAIGTFRMLKGVAALQADVIAHSMGGDVVRTLPFCRNTFADCDFSYEVPGNLDTGDVHRLITIGTPHKGSSLADKLIQNLSAPCGCSWKTVGLFCGGAAGPLSDWFTAETGNIIGGAVTDLQTITASPNGAIYGLNKSSSSVFSIHFVVGIASSSDETVASQNPNGLVAKVNGCESGILSDIRTLFGSDSDLVVSADSQRLGLAAGAIGSTDSWPTYEHLIHSSVITLGTTGFSTDELSSQGIAAAIIQLLGNGSFINKF